MFSINLHKHEQSLTIAASNCNCSGINVHEYVFILCFQILFEMAMYQNSDGPAGKPWRIWILWEKQHLTTPFSYKINEFSFYILL